MLRNRPSINSVTRYVLSLRHLGRHIHSSPWSTLSGPVTVYSPPLRVKVVTIVTGGVQSNIARTERKLPSDSIYLPINAEYERRVVHSQHNAMSHNVYAKSVVKQVLYGPWPWRWLWPWRTNPRPWIWEGHFSHVVRFLVGGWLWCRLFDRYFTSAFKLHKLRGTNPTR